MGSGHHGAHAHVGHSGGHHYVPVHTPIFVPPTPIIHTPIVHTPIITPTYDPVYVSASFSGKTGMLIGGIVLLITSIALAIFGSVCLAAGAFPGGIALWIVAGLGTAGAIALIILSQNKQTNNR